MKQCCFSEGDAVVCSGDVLNEPHQIVQYKVSVILVVRLKGHTLWLLLNLGLWLFWNMACNFVLQLLMVYC